LESKVNWTSFPSKSSCFPMINSPLGRTSALNEVLYPLITFAIWFFNSIELSLTVVGYIGELSRILNMPALFNLLRISGCIEGS